MSAESLLELLRSYEGEHNVLALVEFYQDEMLAAHRAVQRVRVALDRIGCHCDSDSGKVCVACEIAAAIAVDG